MTPAGWAMMIVSLTLVVALTTFCVLRVLATSEDEEGAE